MSKARVLIKLGGATLQNPSVMESLCERIALIQSAGISVVLVHGGGPLINRELTARGIHWQFIDGQRVTTPAMMEVIELVLCGVVNRQIVKGLGRVGAVAVGMSGSDGHTLFCSKQSEELGQVGAIEQVSPFLIHSILNLVQKKKKRPIPVIAPIGIGSQGETYNINADWAAVRIAEALQIKKIVFVTDQDGILGADGRVLPALVDSGVVHGGMLTKVNSIRHGLKFGISKIHIVNGNHSHDLEAVVFDRRNSGTQCTEKPTACAGSDLEKEVKHA
jgi:acetylglutamate kinase